jgi:hypothetical protein
MADEKRQLSLFASERNEDWMAIVVTAIIMLFVVLIK